MEQVIEEYEEDDVVQEIHDAASSVTEEDIQIKGFLREYVKAYKEGRDDCLEGNIYSNPYEDETCMNLMYHEGYMKEFTDMCTAKGVIVEAYRVVPNT